jgi:hypothetical protein
MVFTLVLPEGGELRNESATTPRRSTRCRPEPLLTMTEGMLTPSATARSEPEAPEQGELITVYPKLPLQRLQRSTKCTTGSHSYIRTLATRRISDDFPNSTEKFTFS